MEEKTLHHRLMGVHMLHRQLVMQALAAKGVSRGQPKVLGYLSRHDGCIQRQLAEECHLEPASISSVLQNMERQGLIRREPEEADRRVLHVWLTGQGWDRCEVAERELRQLDDVLLAGFSGEEQDTLFAYLDRIYQNMKAEEGNGSACSD